MSYFTDFMTDDGLLIFYKIYGLFLFGIFLFVYPLSAYLIVFKSPPPMKVYRIFLIIITTSDFLYAFFYGILFLPIPTFPATGAIVFGFAVNINQKAALISFLFLIFCTISTIFAQCYSLMYRFTAFNSGIKFSKFFSKPLNHIFISGYVTFAAILIVYGLTWIYQDNEQIFRFEATQISVYPISLSDEILGFKFTSSLLFYWMAFTLFNLMIAVGGSFIFLYLIFQLLTKRASRMTKKSVKVQKNFARATLIQLMLPFIFLYIPALYSGSQFMFGTSLTASKLSCYIVSFFLASYPLSNTLVTIFYIVSYRKYTICLFKRLFFCIPNWKNAAIIPDVTIHPNKIIGQNVSGLWHTGIYTGIGINGSLSPTNVNSIPRE